MRKILIIAFCFTSILVTSCKKEDIKLKEDSSSLSYDKRTSNTGGSTNGTSNESDITDPKNDPDIKRKGRN